MTLKTRRQFETLARAAERTGLSTRTLRRRIAAGDLIAYRNGPRVIRLDPDDVEPPPDPVVAGVADPIEPETIAALCDTILRGVFTGDLAIALERAASYCRVMSLGAAAIADERDRVDDEHAAELTTRALRYSSFANELHAGARRWRDGTLG